MARNMELEKQKLKLKNELLNQRVKKLDAADAIKDLSKKLTSLNARVR